MVFAGKAREARLRWCDCVQRRDSEDTDKRMMRWKMGQEGQTEAADWLWLPLKGGAKGEN